MRLEVGELITLNSTNRDYVVVKDVVLDGTNYYYLMSAKKPVDVKIVELKVEDGKEVIETVTDKSLLDEILKLSTKKED
jgi:hypothetical protein